MSAVPRIVFFGLPRTGKTGLLHAFADPEAPFPLSHHGDLPKTEQCRVLPSGVELCDVDSPGAQELIVEPDRIQENHHTAKLIRDADAIVLALDASATNDATLNLFQSFASFLERFEDARRRDRFVGGLPIFLTLTKCDRIHHPGESPEDWLRRVHAKQRSVQTAFEDFLAEAGHTIDNPFAFGSLEVHVAATALQFPNDPRFDALEAPFGVEELRDDCTRAAMSHHRRSRHSHRRLRWTLSGAGALLAAMSLALLTFFSLSPTTEQERLIQQVQAYQEREGPAAVRLSDRRIEKNRKTLQSLRDDPAFSTMPAELKDFVNDRLAEFAAYAEYRMRFHPPRIGPAEVRTLTELNALEIDLNTVLQPPEYYAKPWSETEAVRLTTKWRTDAQLLRNAESTLHDWYRGLIRRGTSLLLAPSLDGNWSSTMSQLLSDSENPPIRANDPLPGSVQLPIPRGAPLFGRVPLEFDRVEQARVDWLDTKDRVVALRDLGDALGATGLKNGLLVFPEPTGDLAASAQLAITLLPRLEGKNWDIARFPDPIRSELQARLLAARDHGARHVRAILQSRLQNPSRESWNQAAKWLEDPDAKAWGRLLACLGTWSGTDLADPVTAAIAFLKQDAFESDLSTLEVTLPNDLRERRLFPRGPFTILAKPTKSTSRELRFRATGEPVVTATTTTFRFIPDGHDGKPWFAPGESVGAKLVVRAGETDYILEWEHGEPMAYGFEVLSREPTIRSHVENATRERANGVRLTAPNLPRMPYLLRQN